MVPKHDFERLQVMASGVSRAVIAQGWSAPSHCSLGKPASGAKRSDQVIYHNRLGGLRDRGIPMAAPRRGDIRRRRICEPPGDASDWQQRNDL